MAFGTTSLVSSLPRSNQKPFSMEALGVLLRVSLQGLEPDREVAQRLTENYESNIPNTSNY